MEHIFKWVSSNSGFQFRLFFNSVNSGSDNNGGIISGGENNFIGNNTPGTTDVADFGVIAGGQGNQINANTGLPTPFGVIGGGQSNVINPGTSYGSIFNGNGNQIAGNNSSILGGSGNSDGGFANIGMYGNGLTATKDPATYGVPSAFWVDSIVSPSIPVITSVAGWTTLPVGALYTNVAPNTGFLASQVYVK